MLGTGWILVMTIIALNQYGGSSVTTARFASNQSCVDAGNAWAKQINEMKVTAYSYVAVNKCYKE